jgi:repressor of nif and glnA expression
MENFYEEFKVKGKDLVEKVKSILHEGNVRRIILKDEKGQTFLEIPLSIAALGVLAAPLLAGLGAIAALVSNFTIVVERAAEEPEKKTEVPPSEVPPS